MVQVNFEYFNFCSTTKQWNDFKIKLDDKFTLFNQILKDGQELLSLHQSKGHGALVCYVQAFSALLNLVTMKEKYVHKVTFLHHLQLWAYKSKFRKNEVSKHLLRNDESGRMYGRCLHISQNGGGQSGQPIKIESFRGKTKFHLNVKWKVTWFSIYWIDEPHIHS